MKRVWRAAICLGFVTALGVGLSRAAGGQAGAARSGTTVITKKFPQGMVVVKVHTSALDGGCAKACPTSRIWAEWGVRRVVVIQELTITVNGHPIAVPLSVYSSLFDPARPSLYTGKQGFVLRIGGADGSEAYFALLYFDSSAVRQLKVFSDLDPTHPTQVTRYYPATIGP